MANAGIECVDRPRSKKQNKQSTRQERANILKEYLQERPAITRTDYSHLTGLQQKVIAFDDLVYVRRITPQ